MPYRNALRYRRRSVAWSLSACSGVFLLIGVSGLAAQSFGGGPFIFFVALTLISMVLLVRTYRMATLIASGQTVVIRGFIRSHRIPIGEIRSVTTLDKPNMYAMMGKTIVIKTADGRSIEASEFWAPSSPSGANRLETMAKDLNDWCNARRHEAPPVGA
jgi:hypothetical protein